MIVYSIIVLLVAMLPVLMFLKNSTLFTKATREAELLADVQSIPVSILIPARNEEASIGEALRSLLSSNHGQELGSQANAAIEILVMDDHSEDNTASIVEAISATDGRVRLLHSKPLPENWNGKQHACWQLANAARFEHLLFLDADVRMTSDAISRCLAEQKLRNAPLVSGFPMQETGTLAEKMLIPLMHYVLLGYLPIERMRSTLGVGLAAGCGQLFLAERTAYRRAGGHEAIQKTRHDGIQLPRAFRKAGLRTDIFDASDIARCRMYTSAGQVCNGLLKNATEGIANPRLIFIFTFLLVFGSVLPLASLAYGAFAGWSWFAMALLLTASVIAFIPRWKACKLFQQSYLGAWLHPLGVACFVALQWVALLRQQFGLTTVWRGRK